MPTVYSLMLFLPAERREVAGLYVVSRLRVVLVQLVRGASPGDEERLFTMEDGCSCKKPLHTSIPLMPTTRT